MMKTLEAIIAGKFKPTYAVKISMRASYKSNRYCGVLVKTLLKLSTTRFASAEPNVITSEEVNGNQRPISRLKGLQKILPSEVIHE